MPKTTKLITVIVAHPGQPAHTEQWDKAHVLDLAQKTVGGYVEVLPAGPPGTAVLINEEGRINGLALNVRPKLDAKLQNKVLGIPVCGPIVVLCRGWGDVSKRSAEVLELLAI